MESPADWALHYRQGSHRIHYHAVYFNFIPPWVFEKYSEARSLFDEFLVFSEEGKDFLSLIDQMHLTGGKNEWIDVTKLDWFQESVEEMARNRRYTDAEVSLLGFIPEQPEKK